MCIPLRDENPKKSFPIVTLTLIALNFAIYVIGNLRFDYRMIVEKYGYVAGEHSITAIPKIFSSMFIHGGLFHLIFNMWFLWIFGDNIEDTLGKKRYILFYLSGGFFASLVYTLFNLNSNVPAVGAVSYTHLTLPTN